eukprot:TRINITY_DN10332_c0_g1_i1.p1 TRINITY_DN10332_c0_g1~~TRINITY_DN10332_c0_g1_i1.p1  ORF type:complete len:765 (+),score=74.49 TRINITY_DN10332_c0_g1_i1:55-2349(+)
MTRKCLRTIVNSYRKGNVAVGKEWWDSKATPEHVRGMVREHVQQVKEGTGNEVEEALLLCARLEPEPVGNGILKMFNRLLALEEYIPTTELPYACVRYQRHYPGVVDSLMKKHVRNVAEQIITMHPPHLSSLLTAYAHFRVSNSVLLREATLHAVKNVNMLTTKRLCSVMKALMILDGKHEAGEVMEAIERKIVKDPAEITILSFMNIVTLIRGMILINSRNRFLIHKFATRIVSMRSFVFTEYEEDSADALRPADVALCLWGFQKLSVQSQEVVDRLGFLIKSGGVPKGLIRPLDVVLMLKGLASSLPISDLQSRREVLTILISKFTKQVTKRAVTFQNIVSVLEACCKMRHDTKPVQLLAEASLHWWKGGNIPTPRHFSSMLNSFMILSVKKPYVFKYFETAAHRVLSSSEITSHDAQLVCKASVHYTSKLLLEPILQIKTFTRAIVPAGILRLKPPATMLDYMQKTDTHFPPLEASAILHGLCKLQVFPDCQSATVVFFEKASRSLARVQPGTKNHFWVAEACVGLNLLRSSTVLNLASNLRDFIMSHIGSIALPRLVWTVRSWGLLQSPCVRASCCLSAALVKNLSNMTGKTLAMCFGNIGFVRGTELEKVMTRVYEILEDNEAVGRVDLCVSVMMHARWFRNRVVSALCRIVETEDMVFPSDKEYSECFKNLHKHARASVLVADLLDILQQRCAILVCAGLHRTETLFSSRRTRSTVVGKPSGVPLLPSTHRSPRPRHPAFDQNSAVPFGELMEILCQG